MVKLIKINNYGNKSFTSLVSRLNEEFEEGHIFKNYLKFDNIFG